MRFSIFCKRIVVEKEKLTRDKTIITRKFSSITRKLDFDYPVYAIGTEIANRSSTGYTNFLRTPRSLSFDLGDLRVLFARELITYPLCTPTSVTGTSPWGGK